MNTTFFNENRFENFISAIYKVAECFIKKDEKNPDYIYSSFLKKIRDKNFMSSDFKEKKFFYTVVKAIPRNIWITCIENILNNRYNMLYIDETNLINISHLESIVRTAFLKEYLTSFVNEWENDSEADIKWLKKRMRDIKKNVRYINIFELKSIMVEEIFHGSSTYGMGEEERFAIVNFLHSLMDVGALSGFTTCIEIGYGIPVVYKGE